MKRNVGVVLALALVSSLSVTTASATPVKSYYPGFDSLGYEDFAGPRSVTYSTSFDEGEGYFPGNTLDGQNGWTQTGTNLAFGTVQQFNPSAGDGHYRQVRDTTVASGASLRTGGSPIGPLDGTYGVGDASYSLDTYFHIGADNFTEADFHFRTFSPNSLNNNYNLSSYIDMFYQDGDGDGVRGEITVWAGDLDASGTLTNGDFFNTGVEYARDIYKTLRVDLNPSANLQTVYYGGVLVYAGVLPGPTYPGAFLHGTGISTLQISHDNWIDANPDGSANPALGEFTDYDNLSITPTPEPATLTLLALGALGLIRRRR